MLITLFACVEAMDPGGDAGLDPIGSEDPGDPVGEPEPPTDDGIDVDDPEVVVPPEEPVDDDPDWDGEPPEGPEGTEVYAVVSCTLFREPVDVTFVKTNDPWLWKVELGPEGSLRVPELAPCYPLEESDPPVALWDPAPRITIVSDGMVHTLEQTMRPDFWSGGLLPMEGSSEECDLALAELGLGWPLPLTMTVLDEAPEEE